MNKQSMVDEFMRLAGQYKGLDKPDVPDLESRILRARLLMEEVIEFIHAEGLAISHWSFGLDAENLKFYPTGYQSEHGGVPQVAKELSDILYVTYGAAVAWGIKIDSVFGAVHHSNMQKFGPGSYAREDGKWIKPPDWEPPDIEAILLMQGWDGRNEKMFTMQASEAEGPSFL